MKLTFNEDKHEYTNEKGEKVPSVTTILGAISNQGYSEVSDSILDYAKKRGSLVHECVQLYDYGIPFEENLLVTPEIHNYIIAYLNFLRDYKVEWHCIEEIVYNEKEGYCGTVDRAGYIDGKPVVLDIKTNKKPSIENKMCVCSQTYAYLKALPKEYANAKRYALYLKADGDYTFFSCEDFEKNKGYDAGLMFNKCLDIYKEIVRLKKLGRRNING